MSRAPTRVVAADILPSAGWEIITVQSDAVGVHAFADFAGAPTTQRIQVESTARDVVGMGPGRLVIAHEGTAAPTLATRNDDGWTLGPWPGDGYESIEDLFAGDIDGDGRPDLARLPSRDAPRLYRVVVELSGGRGASLPLTPTRVWLLRA